jgi:hypothetical protein
VAALLALGAAAIQVMACGASEQTAGSPAPTSAVPSAAPTAGGTVSGPQRSPAPKRPAPGPAASGTKSVPAPPSLIGLGVPQPVGLRIPAIGVDSGISLLDRSPDGSIQLPGVDQPGWYMRGSAPGDVGVAVILGEVRSSSGTGVFGRLSSLRAGDPIAVQRADGSELTFTTGRRLPYASDAFPAADVYQGSGRSELRLITYGGTATSGAPAPGDLVVFATLSG